MIPNICDGDIVIVRPQDDAETGDIVIATVNGTDATCKRLRKYKDGIESIANNPTYDPLDFSNKEILEKPVIILIISIIGFGLTMENENTPNKSTDIVSENPTVVIEPSPQPVMPTAQSTSISTTKSIQKVEEDIVMDIEENSTEDKTKEEQILYYFNN